MLAFQIYAVSVIFFHVSEFTLAAIFNPELLGWSCKFCFVRKGNKLKAGSFYKCRMN